MMVRHLLLVSSFQVTDVTVEFTINQALESRRKVWARANGNVR